jgi:hypothetical protein
VNAGLRTLDDGARIGIECAGRCSGEGDEKN